MAEGIATTTTMDMYANIFIVNSMTHQDLEGSNTPSQELDNDFDNISYAESMIDPQKGQN